MIEKYKIITLCGSTKFKDEFIKAQKELTLAGYIVISVGLFGHSGDNEVWNDNVKEMLDDMHKKKIDMADAIMIIDVNDYIGESTKKEIEYAKSKGKIIYFYNHPEMYYDDVGGFHDSATGYNPNGVYCGECTMKSCKNCNNRNLKLYDTGIYTYEIDEFIKHFCHNCGSQRCEGVGTEWFDGCRYKEYLKTE